MQKASNAVMGISHLQPNMQFIGKIRASRETKNMEDKFL